MLLVTKLASWAIWPLLSSAAGASRSCSAAPGLHIRSIPSLHAYVAGRAGTAQYAKLFTRPMPGQMDSFFRSVLVILGHRPSSLRGTDTTNPAVRYGVPAADESRKPRST